MMVVLKEVIVVGLIAIILKKAFYRIMAIMNNATELVWFMTVMLKAEVW
jgi:hypothetical protein